jgi:hypothetical protein
MALCILLHVGFAVGAVEVKPILTRWAADVSPTNVHPEYPRPQFVRKDWLNLNGLWDYAITQDNQHPPLTYAGQILVPFPIESQLSGVNARLDESSTLWYRRKFKLPQGWKGQRILLNFGAVDWSATVLLNGKVMGSHRGGYDTFSFDLTDGLHVDGDNELVVAVMDPTEGDQPRGKQSRKPEGIFYSSTSGIWQTVWLEPVGQVRLTSVRFVTELETGSVRVWPQANTHDPQVEVDVVALLDGVEVGRMTCAVGQETSMKISKVLPWSPSSPQLYDLSFKLRRGAAVLDEVGSYFGMREVYLGVDASGEQQIFLNGQPLFQTGVLDQGYWPDGLYTAPTDEALRHDLLTARKLGFNLVRKHVKVEPERWYYWADRLGLLVWQDMPSGNNATEEGRREFRRELERMVEQKFNHPSVVMWVLFNEGWGQFDTERLVRWLKAIDPTRLVNNASGWTDAKTGDVIDVHSYPDPVVPSPEPARAGVIGEFGGLGLGIDGHTWSDQTWGYQSMQNKEKLTSRYCALLDKVWELQKANGLAAAVYTQLTDVESECNGFLTYDREVLKVDVDRVAEANSRKPVALNGAIVMPSARYGAFSWRYTTNPPPEGWMNSEFDDSNWDKAPGGFGSTQTPGAVVRTGWLSPDIWLRRAFFLDGQPSKPLKLIIHHDEDAQVYLNGVFAAKLTGYAVGYLVIDITPEAQAAVRQGQNLISIHCHQSTGGQFIDAGIVEVNRQP